MIHAGTRRDGDGILRSSGGRVLSATAIGVSLAEARAAAYRLVSSVELPGGQYRTLSAGNIHVIQSQGQVRVVFAEDITEHELRALLSSIGGTIVQGPSPLGVYTVGIPQPGNRSDLVRLVQTMRVHPKVRLAEPITVR